MSILLDNHCSDELTTELIKYYNLTHYKQLNEDLKVRISNSDIPIRDAVHVLFNSDYSDWSARLSRFYSKVDIDLQRKIFSDLKDFQSDVSWGDFVYDHMCAVKLSGNVIASMFKPYVRTHKNWEDERDQYVEYYRRVLAVYALTCGFGVQNGRYISHSRIINLNHGFIATSDDLGHVYGKVHPNQGTYQFIWPRRLSRRVLLRSSLSYLKDHYIEPLEIVISDDGKSYQFMTKQQEKELFGYDVI